MRQGEREKARDRNVDRKTGKQAVSDTQTQRHGQMATETETERNR